LVRRCRGAAGKSLRKLLTGKSYMRDISAAKRNIAISWFLAKPAPGISLQSKKNCQLHKTIENNNNENNKAE